MSRALGLFILLLLTAACSQRSPTQDQIDPADRPDQESWDVSFFIETDNQPRAHLQAPYVARFERPDSTFARFGPSEDRLDRVIVDVFDENGEESATVEADRLTYFEDRRTFVATGGVVVNGRDERRLEGERLVWHEADAELRSDGFVRITTPTEQLQGYELVADETLERYRLARITGQVQIQDE